MQVGNGQQCFDSLLQMARGLLVVNLTIDCWMQRREYHDNFDTLSFQVGNEIACSTELVCIGGLNLLTQTIYNMQSIGFEVAVRQFPRALC